MTHRGAPVLSPEEKMSELEESAYSDKVEILDLMDTQARLESSLFALPGVHSVGIGLVDGGRYGFRIKTSKASPQIRAGISARMGDVRFQVIEEPMAQAF